jgi:hypothetical protein
VFTNQIVNNIVGKNLVFTEMAQQQIVENPPKNTALGRLEAWIVKDSGWLALGIVVAAFAMRLAYASCCYLNPDEGTHFALARPSSWLGAYEASRHDTSPGLDIMVLHGMMFIGRTELILRLPSLLAGTAALWVTFAWLRRILGEIPALAGLAFMTLSHGAISASTEVREYGLVLFFVCVSLYATEYAFADRSTFWAIIQGLFLIGALLTHYTAIVVIISVGLFTLVRLLSGDVPRRMLFTISASYAVLGILLVWLYFGQVRGHIPYGSRVMQYLENYYYTASETPLGFVWRSLSHTFTYAVGARRGALLIMLVFTAGLGALLTGRTKAPRLTALLVIAPFAVGFAAAIARVFPFAGSRHQTYLLPFLAAGIAAALAWLRRGVALPMLLLVAVIAPFWLITRTPDNDCRMQSTRDMDSAVEYVGRTVPLGAALFVDQETYELLTYYLGRNDPNIQTLQVDPNIQTQQVRPDTEEPIGGYRLVIPKLVWAFRPNEVLEQVSQSAKELGVPPSEPLWIVSVSWAEPSLASRLPAGQNREVREFGRISVIKIPALRSSAAGGFFCF